MADESGTNEDVQEEVRASLVGEHRLPTSGELQGRQPQSSRFTVMMRLQSYE